jgi:hypothetical protein
MELTVFRQPVVSRQCGRPLSTDRLYTAIARHALDMHSEGKQAIYRKGVMKRYLSTLVIQGITL